MKVKQTSQRVSKGPGGHCVVGATRNASVVVEFDALFNNEMGSLTNQLYFCTTNHPMNHTEYDPQHVLSSTDRNTFNRNVMQLLAFVLERQNPYSATVNVVVPATVNVLIKLWLRVCSYVSRMVSGSTVHTGRRG